MTSKEWAKAALRQLREAGLDELYLDGITRAEALARARNLPSSAAPGGAPSGARSVEPSVQPRVEQSVEPRVEHRVAASTEPGAETTLPSATYGAVSPAAPDGYEALRTEALACTRCALSNGRTQVVFSDGHPDARLMVVGEAPGQNEDATGVPFVGRAGQMLDLLLSAVGLSRKESVYICNVLKCRPPGNRNPLPDEIEQCSPYLLRQIELVKPEVILAVGTFAAQLLTGQPISIGKLRGTVYSYGGAPLVVTYHPAALLRNQSWVRKTWDDLQLLAQVLDGAQAPGSGDAAHA